MNNRYNIYAVQETTVTNSGTIGKVDCRKLKISLRDKSMLAVE